VGHDVLCVDNYFTGNKDNIGAHMGSGHPHFKLMRHDVTSRSMSEASDKPHQVDRRQRRRKGAR
jgi:UDP-glucuronate decarboxylase